MIKQMDTPYTDKARAIMARSGKAMPDGSFPINTRQDLTNAITSYGRSPRKRLAKAHITNRAMDMHLVALLPEKWKIKK